MYHNIITKTTERFNTNNSFVCIKNSYIQSHKIEALCTHTTITGQNKTNIIAKNCFIHIFNKIKKIDGNTTKINFCELQKYCGGKNRITIRRALNYLEDKKMITKFFKRFLREGKFNTEVFVTVNMEIIADITNKNPAKIHDSNSNMKQFCTIYKQNTNKEDIANIEKQSSLNNMEEKNDVRSILSRYSLNEKTVDRLSNEIGIIIKDKDLKFSNRFMLKRYVDKVILSLKENAITWNNCVDVLSFSYKMSDIKLKPDLLKEISDKSSREIPEWLCIKLMNKLSSGKGFRDRSSFVEYMSKVFANEMRFDIGNQVESKLKIYDEFDFITSGDCNKATKILEKRNSFRDVRRNGVDLLFTAVQNGFSDIAKILIEKGCDVNLKYDGGYNALFASVISNNIDVVRLLIDNGIDINSKLDDGSNVLIFGLEKGLISVEVIDYLICLGIDINYRNKFGKTALCKAAKYSNIDVVKHLLKFGASFTMNKDCCAEEFLIALKRGSFDIADLIVDCDKRTSELVSKEELHFSNLELENYYLSRNKINNDTTSYYKVKILEASTDINNLIEDLRIVKTDGDNGGFCIRVKDKLTRVLLLRNYSTVLDCVMGQGNWGVFCCSGYF